MDKFKNFFNKKSVLVTGGAGAIGSNIVRALANFDSRIIILDDLSSGFRVNVPKHGNIDFFKDSIVNDRILKAIFKKKIDYVIHLAAHFANQNSIEHPEKDLLVNALGTLKLLEYSRKSVKRFIYSSSSCVYGNKDSKMNEEMVKKLETPYAISKLTGEEYVHFFHRYYGLNSTVVRYFNAYGPGDPPGKNRNVIPNFMLRAMHKQPLIITGTGKETRDFTFMDDVVAGTLSALSQEKAIGEVYNIGSGREEKIIDLANLINKITGNPAGIKFAEARKWDTIKKRSADISKSKSQLGYDPKIPLELGLTKTWEWFKVKYGK